MLTKINKDSNIFVKTKNTNNAITKKDIKSKSTNNITSNTVIIRDLGDPVEDAVELHRAARPLLI